MKIKGERMGSRGFHVPGRPQLPVTGRRTAPADTGSPSPSCPCLPATRECLPELSEPAAGQWGGMGQFTPRKGSPSRRVGKATGQVSPSPILWRNAIKAQSMLSLRGCPAGLSPSCRSSSQISNVPLLALPLHSHLTLPAP